MGMDLVSGNGRKGAHTQVRPYKPLRKLAIVGSHPATRELAPYDDPEYEIWLFNEAAQKPEVYRRWDALLQMHKEHVYTSLTNWVNKDHWQWLQQDHGERRIFMQEVDPRVPNSVRYPLEEVLKIVPYRYLRSSPALALALAIYLGYQDISLYGSEVTSNTEYHYQAVNLAFWIGLCHGRGIAFHLECWQTEFDQPIYGYEGEMQVQKDVYEERIQELETAARLNGKMRQRVEAKLEQAMLAGNFEKTGDISLNLENIAKTAGEAEGALTEARRYLAREDMISRQEFERVSARAQSDGEGKLAEMNHSAGKCEYVWNVWRQTGSLQALQQLRQFLKEKTEQAYEAGRLKGVFRENIQYMNEYDKVVLALGGPRAIHQVMERA